MVKTLKLLTSKKMRWMLPQIIWTGGSIAYWSGLLTPIFTLILKTESPDMEEHEILEKSLLAFVCFGVGQSISGIMMGKVIDYSNSKKACLLNIAFMVLTFGVSVRNLTQLKFGAMSYVTCLVWGLQDGVVNTHCFQMLGFEFDTQSDPFSIFALVQGVSVFVF